MRFFKTMLTSASMLLASAATAMAAPIALLQDPQAPVKVDVHTSETHTVWYADPVWIAVGAIVVLLIIVPRQTTAKTHLTEHLNRYFFMADLPDGPRNLRGRSTAQNHVDTP